jgi:signal transduction histidine kinase
MARTPDRDAARKVADDGHPARPPVRRDETDDSLRAERRTVDALDKIGRTEADADRIVEIARDRADAVLTDARAKADQAAPGDSVDPQRNEADELLEDERATADALLRREREDSARVLSALLPLARQSTDRKLMTERAFSDAALSSRDDFMGMVSHDLNNLLGAIVLAVGGIERRSVPRGEAETPESKRIAKSADRVLLYAARMRRLIADLVDVTSMDAGKVGIDSRAYDGRALIAETVETFRSLAAEKNLSIEAAFTDGSLNVVCDPERILQVLANLVGNAVKFTARGGRIFLLTGRDGAEVKFSVSDTGPGIPPHLLAAIFERFWQAGSNDRRGRGLGLYIAKGIIEAHGGRIWVESRVGEGSSFHFTLQAL